MAIVPEVSGLPVEIHVDGTVAPEYSPPADAVETTGRQITKYIEVRPGANFEIHLQVGQIYQPRSHSLSWQAYVDGRHLDGKITTKKELVRKTLAIKNVIDGEGSWSGETYIKRKCQFSQLHLSMFPRSPGTNIMLISYFQLILQALT
jgi:hypothetical protein